MCYVRNRGTAKPECNTIQSRCDDRRRAVLSQRRDGDRGGTRRRRSEHHRAGADSARAPQSPSTQQTPSGAAPAQTEQKSDTLPTVSVQASRPRAPAAVRAAPPSRPVAAPPPPAQPVATNQAGSGGTNPPLGPTPYQVTNTGITRLPVPILNMPQTVNVIPQAIIQEQNATTIEQALQYIPGITFSAGEGGQQGDGPIIRGFVARGDLFRDGIRDPGWYTRDAFSIDRIEVYKGPSAFAFGRGATGGAINYVTRLPTGANYLEVDLDGDDRQRLPRGGRRQRQERQRVRPHPGTLPGRQHPDPRPDLDQALGCRAVHGLRLPAGHQGHAVLHLSGRGGRVGLRFHVSSAAGGQSPDRQPDQSRLLRRRQADASTPDSTHQFPRDRGRAARRYHADRHPHHHGKGRA